MSVKYLVSVFSSFLFALVLSACDSDSFPETSPLTTSIPLNDTGITWGGNYPETIDKNATCIGETIGQQDCSHGRDATHDDDSDGHAGFSYTKLDTNGNPLAASATEWSCVQDNVAGLIWEVKTDDGSLQDADWTYMSTTNMADHDDPRGDDDNGICLASPSNTDGIYCHTEGFRSAVNTQGLCGASDWRLPTYSELIGLVHFGRLDPAIDLEYFPNQGNLHAWSGSPSARNSSSAWGVYFGNGHSFDDRRSYSKSVRLVRSGQ